METFSKWLKYTKAAVSEQSNQKQVIKQIQKIIKRDWNKTEKIPIGDSKIAWTKNFQEGNVKITLSRLIRGDLIEVFVNDKSIAEWVDQSHHYNGLMGLNDIVVYFSFENLEKELAK